MTERDFVYWLQGYMELENPIALSETQTQQIKDHLALVFKKETPFYKIHSDGVNQVFSNLATPCGIHPDLHVSHSILQNEGPNIQPEGHFNIMTTEDFIPAEGEMYDNDSQDHPVSC